MIIFMKKNRIKNILLFTILLSLYSSAVNMAFSQNFWEEYFVASTTTREIKENSAGHLFCATFNGVYTSTNFKTWKHSGLEGLSLYSLEINPENDHIYVGLSRAIYRSTDNGETWQQIDFNFVDNVTCLYFSRNKDLFAGIWGGIFKSSDGGVTWKRVHTCSGTMNVTSIIDAGNGILFAGITGWMGGGGVYRSDDNGDNWEHIGLDNAYIQSLAIDSKGTLFAGSIGNFHSYEEGVYKSSDLGETWKFCSYSNAMSLVIDADNILYRTTNYDSGPGGMFRSNDEGATWERIASGMSDPRVYYLHLSRLGFLYAYGNSTGELYRSAQPVATGILNSKISLSLKAYPNPFTDKLQIGGLTSDRATISISDLLGKEVYRGVYTGDAINLSHLLPGVYILNVKADGKSGAYKIVKQ